MSDNDTKTKFSIFSMNPKYQIMVLAGRVLTSPEMLVKSVSQIQRDSRCVQLVNPVISLISWATIQRDFKFGKFKSPEMIG